jgi:6-phosphogluconolactonase
LKLKQLMIFAATLLSVCMGISVASATNTVGAVYVMTNDAAGNEIVIFDRDARGKLTNAHSVPTGRDGSGGGLDPLGSQGSIVLTRDHRWLLAVNAGSDEISVFRVQPYGNGLILIGNFNAGGTFPVSLTIFHNLVYVLNADSPNITGFYLTHWGELKPLADSTRSLGAGAFSQVGFDPKGRNLIITNRADNSILVYSVDKDGLPSMNPVSSPSSGAGPFGFIFDRRGHLVVSEAGSGAVTSYDVLFDDSLHAISPSVANGQMATCWIAANWLYAFTANTGSDTISSYRVNFNGILALLDATAGFGNKPIDLATTRFGRFLYVLNAGNGTDGSVGMFRIKLNGGLVDMGTVDVGLSNFAQGIAVR